MNCAKEILLAKHRSEYGVVHFNENMRLIGRFDLEPPIAAGSTYPEEARIHRDTTIQGLFAIYMSIARSLSIDAAS